MKNLKISALVSIGIAFSSIISCSNNDRTDTTDATVEVPAVYKKIYGATSITNDGTYIYIKTKDLPDHKSAYYQTTKALYEAYSGTTFGGNTFVRNPNSIIEQTSDPIGSSKKSSIGPSRCRIYIKFIIYFFNGSIIDKKKRFK